MNPSRLKIVLLAAPVAVSLGACGINTVPTAEEQAKKEWADVQAAYQRRASLIPNLVETVKGFAKQEREVLTQVTEARARAVQVNVSPEQISDPQAMQRYSQAQAGLGSALNGLRVVFERYPELRSNANFLALQSQLEGTENRINVEIQDYNEAVRQYNTRIRTFPDVIGAKIFYGAEPIQPFQAAPGAEQTPTVKF